MIVKNVYDEAVTLTQTIGDEETFLVTKLVEAETTLMILPSITRVDPGNI